MLFLIVIVNLFFAAPELSAQTNPTEILLESVNLGEPPKQPFDLEKFKKAIADGANINGQNFSGQTPILLAAISHSYLPDGHVDKEPLFEAMKLLMSKGANVNIGDKIGITPLMHTVHRVFTSASSSGHPVPKFEYVYDLFFTQKNPKIEVDSKNVYGQTALSYLAGRGPEAERVMKKFIDRGADIYVQDVFGSTIVSNVVAGGSVDSLKSTLDFIPADKRKEQLELANYSNSTPLFRAARAGQLAMVKYLVETYGVNLNTINTGYETPLSAVEARMNAPRTSATAKTSFKSVSAYLIQKGGKRPPAVNPSAITCKDANTEPFDFNKLSRVISSCRIKSVDELIPLLPVSHRSNYILSYAARGIQEASFAYPRVVTLGLNGDLIMAFNGHKDQKGYNTLELIEFKQKPARFEMREIDFSSGSARTSTANPSKCLACHGKTPRPLWDNWYVWPGFYNSEQGAMYPQERAKYALYEQNRPQGRYKHLYESSDSYFFTKTLGINTTTTTIKNVKFDIIVDDQMSEVMVDDLMKSQKLKKFKYAIFGALSCQRPVADFLPTSVSEKLKPIAEITKETKELDVAEFTERLSRQKKVMPGSPEGGYALLFLSSQYKVGQSHSTDRVSRLRYLVEGLGETMDWSNTFEVGGPKRYVLRGMRHLEAKLFVKWLSPTNPKESEIWKLYNKRYQELPVSFGEFSGVFRGHDSKSTFPGVNDTQVCDGLQKLSLETIGSVRN